MTEIRVSHASVVRNDLDIVIKTDRETIEAMYSAYRFLLLVGHDRYEVYVGDIKGSYVKLLRW